MDAPKARENEFMLARNPEGMISIEWSNGDRSFTRGNIFFKFLKYYIKRIWRRHSFTI